MDSFLKYSNRQQTTTYWCNCQWLKMLPLLR